jgi:hypothetical protein
MPRVAKKDARGTPAVSSDDAWKNSQPYRLGSFYKELGELLMDPTTDLLELMEYTKRTGIQFVMSVVPPEDEATSEAGARRTVGV